MIENYILRHFQANEYIMNLSNETEKIYKSIYGWSDRLINNNLIVSFRDTYYTKSGFREKLHAHDFYELVVYLGGNIRYISESKEFDTPESADIIFSPPGQIHTAALNSESKYTRFVFYFSSEAFNCVFGRLPKLRTDISFIRLSRDKEHMLEILCRIKETLCAECSDAELFIYSYVIQLFSLIGSASSFPINIDSLPSKALEIKHYIDAHITEIQNISEIAEHFFYSREHISRYFASIFNVSIGRYITERKIDISCRLLREGCSVTEACYNSGFNNVSFFIKQFSRKCGKTPLKYAKDLNGR